MSAREDQRDAISSDERAQREVPPWSTPIEAGRLIVLGTTWRTSFPVACLVGSILTVVNQGAVIVAGDASATTWVRTAFNFLVPFVVSSVGYLAPFRTPRLSGGRFRR